MRTTARELAREAAELAEAGRCDEAVDRFERAYALVQAPTIAVHQARCLVQLGRFLEAVDRYELVQRTPLEPNPPTAFSEAVEEARGALTALRPRIPQLKITVNGVDADDPTLKVLLNDRELPRALLGVERAIDPGDYEVSASAKAKVDARKTVSIPEGTTHVVELELVPVVSEDEISPSSPVLEQPDEPSPAVDRSPPARTWGWVLMGFGGAGVGAGVATALMAQSKEKSLSEACAGLECPESSRDDLDSMNLLRTLSFVGYGVGIAAVATGGVLLLTSTGTDSKSARTELGIGLRSVVVRGSF